MSVGSRLGLAAVASTLTACSLLDPLDDYAAASAGATGGAGPSGSVSSTSSTSSSASGGGPTGGGGAGGAGADGSDDCSAPPGPVHAFADTFDDGAIGTGWFAYPPGCASESSSMLVLTTPSPSEGTGYCLLSTCRKNYSLVDDALVVHVAKPPSKASEQLVVYLRSDGDKNRSLRLLLVNGSFSAAYTIDAATELLVNETTYVLGRDDFWHVALQGGTLVVGTSSDGGSAFEPLATDAAPPVDLSAIEVVLAVGRVDTLQVDSASFAGYNVP